MSVKRRMSAGADVWLNTPLPPLEASGTSGMKAAMNGVLNLSVLDGWWLEAVIEGVNGWSVGSDRDDGGHHAEDLDERLAATALPMLHDDPARWRSMMKQAIGTIASIFNRQRMMRRHASEAHFR